MERKGASYKITEKRAANHHGEHTQRTNATIASEMYGGETYDTKAHISKNGVMTPVSDQEYGNWRGQQKQREYGGY